MSEGEKYINRKEAARYLTERHFKVSANTLAKWASEGKGPPFSKMGRHPIYKISDLDAFLQASFKPAPDYSKSRVVRSPPIASNADDAFGA